MNLGLIDTEKTIVILRFPLLGTLCAFISTAGLCFLINSKILTMIQSMILSKILPTGGVCTLQFIVWQVKR